jgi:hypothetical protein
LTRSEASDDLEQILVLYAELFGQLIDSHFAHCSSASSRRGAARAARDVPSMSDLLLSHETAENAHLSARKERREAATVTAAPQREPCRRAPSVAASERHGTATARRPGGGRGREVAGEQQEPGTFPQAVRHRWGKSTASRVIVNIRL